MMSGENEGLRAGAALSLALHAGVALFVAFGLPSLWSKPLPRTGVVSVDLVMESADSLAVYEPQEITSSDPAEAQSETLEPDEAVADTQSEALEAQDIAALEPDSATRQEQVEEARSQDTLVADDVPQSAPDPALDNAVTLARTIPPETLESREVPVTEPETSDPEALAEDAQPVEAAPAQSLTALVAREIQPQAEVSTAKEVPVQDPVQTDLAKSESVAALEVAPEKPVEPVQTATPTPVQALEAEADTPPLPAPPLPRSKPQRIAALPPDPETEPKKKEKTRPKKKKARSFSDQIASSLSSSKPRKRTSAGNTPKLTNAEWDPLKRMIRKCWRLDRGAKEQAVVSIQVRLTRGGYIDGRPKWLDQSSSNSARVAYQNALRALQKCEPFDVLPARKYAGWQEIEMVFRPNGVGVQ